MTRIGAYENQHLKLFDVGVTLSIKVGSGFLFSVRKQKTENFLKISNRTQNVTPPPERAEKKYPESHLGFFSVDLIPTWKKICRFLPGSACSAAYFGISVEQLEALLPWLVFFHDTTLHVAVGWCCGVLMFVRREPLRIKKQKAGPISSL